ncbi:hypothetical protein IMW82_08785 [Rhodanobacter sp. B2A1Ga4]|uniref:hypothetical protein n=1 Tax=Rhodanobacter TaxID=75309 RepID=UPI000D355CF0|nr:MULTISPECIES: hypothetical protein [Rhodanobacter]MBQ4854765.1 hypothetical protein [Rhodanobacter sp. B2A1Ga4]
MRATHWLIGCVLCLAGIGSAAAASPETTQDLDSTSHAALDNASSHDGNNSSGGDALGLTRDCPPSGSSDSSGGTSGNGSGRSGGASSAPTPTRRPHLGWQSLLPGSIQ